MMSAEQLEEVLKPITQDLLLEVFLYKSVTLYHDGFPEPLDRWANVDLTVFQKLNDTDSDSEHLWEKLIERDFDETNTHRNQQTYLRYAKLQIIDALCVFYNREMANDNNFFTGLTSLTKKQMQEYFISNTSEENFTERWKIFSPEVKNILLAAYASYINLTPEELGELAPPIEGDLTTWNASVLGRLSALDDWCDTPVGQRMEEIDTKWPQVCELYKILVKPQLRGGNSSDMLGHAIVQCYPFRFIRDLVCMGAHVNFPGHALAGDFQGCTPLMTAIFNPTGDKKDINTQTIDFLLIKSGNIDICINDTGNALLYAIEARDARTIKNLLRVPGLRTIPTFDSDFYGSDAEDRKFYMEVSLQFAQETRLDALRTKKDFAKAARYVSAGGYSSAGSTTHHDHHGECSSQKSQSKRA